MIRRHFVSCIPRVSALSMSSKFPIQVPILLALADGHVIRWKAENLYPVSSMTEIYVFQWNFRIPSLKE
ncbi:hypothetical protein SLA2020_264240 [Shorea laevis]